MKKNSIDKLIRHYVCEIFVTVILVVFSIPLWNMLDKSDSAAIAKSYSTMDYLYLDIDKYIAKDGFADVVTLANDTNTTRGYNLIVKIDKNIDTTGTIIAINGDEENLENLKYNEDKKYVYYSLAEGNLVANKEKYEIDYYNSELNYDEVLYEIVEDHNV